MAIQVVNAVSNVAWTTDKVEIATTTANVTFQVSVVQLTYVQANGVPANATMTTATGNLNGHRSSCHCSQCPALPLLLLPTVTTATRGQHLAAAVVPQDRGGVHGAERGPLSRPLFSACGATGSLGAVMCTATTRRCECASTETVLGSGPSTPGVLVPVPRHSKLRTRNLVLVEWMPAILD